MIIEWLDKMEQDLETYSACWVTNTLCSLGYIESSCRGVTCDECKERALKIINDIRNEVEEPKQAISDKTSDNVNHPNHYNTNKYECIDEMVAVFGVEDVKAFCKCNAWKYRYRSDAKNGEEDLKKADWYLEKLMELKEK